MASTQDIRVKIYIIILYYNINNKKIKIIDTIIKKSKR